MKQTIIIHGMPSEEGFYNPVFSSPSNSHWFPWLQKKLVLRNELSQTPEMPQPFDPIYENWKKVFEQFEVDADTILIGHSCGGGFLLRYLSENKDMIIHSLFLIAPWITDTGNDLTTDLSFLECDIDANMPNRFPVQVFTSSDDDSVMQDSFKLLKEKLPNAIYHEFTDKEHFCTPEFPELLELL